MSIRIMTAVWASEMPPGVKLVALALADIADDAGRCWPSVSTLRKKTSQSERTVRGAIRVLERMKMLIKEERSGRSTVYFLTPADFAPLQDLHPTPAESAPPPLQILPTTPAESAPRIIKEPSIEPPKKRVQPINGARHDLEIRFQKFWQTYPRKVAKPIALRAWLKIMPSEGLSNEIERDVLDRCRSPDWMKDRGAYIPHPATYLNQRRWEDCLTDLKGKT